MMQVEEAFTNTTMEKPPEFLDFVRGCIGPFELPVSSDEDEAFITTRPSVCWSTREAVSSDEDEAFITTRPVCWSTTEPVSFDRTVITTGLAEAAVSAGQSWLSSPSCFVVQQAEGGSSWFLLPNLSSIMFSSNASHGDVLVRNAALAVIERIRELGTYPAGWNRPDTVAPSISAINDAVQFVRNQDLASIHLPSIGAADDGEINFWWDVDGLYMDLGFFGDGSYSFYARLPNGKEITVDQAPVSQPLPQEILKFLKKSD